MNVCMIRKNSTEGLHSAGVNRLLNLTIVRNIVYIASDKSDSTNVFSYLVFLSKCIAIELPSKAVHEKPRLQAHEFDVCLSFKLIFLPTQHHTTTEGLQDGSHQLVTTAKMTNIASKVSHSPPVTNADLSGCHTTLTRPS